MKWLDVWRKAGAVLGYKKGVSDGFPKGLEEGRKQGEMTALILTELLKDYGSFEAIPPMHLLKLPNGVHLSRQQFLKRVYLALRSLVVQVGLPEFPKLGDDLADWLEHDANQSDELTDAFEEILNSNSVYGALLSFAEGRGELDVEAFLSRLHNEPPLLKRYYACLKNETHVNL